MKIILGSQSPRRSEILKSLGYDFDVRVSNSKEVSNKTDPKDYVLDIANQKLESISHTIDELVICADTIVVFDNEILGKPKDASDAYRMLKKLSGNTHQVMTAVAFTYQERKYSFLDIATVKVLPLADEKIYAYIKTGEPMDKAGAYGIQGLFGKYIESYDGDFYTIMGLPKNRFNEELNSFIKK